MFLKSLSLINYKNFDKIEFDFDSKINCLVGNNGVGKTNVLDAIYHLVFAKSYFSARSQDNICHGEDFYAIDGRFEKNNREEHIICSIRKGDRKIINRNGKTYKRLLEHIGLLSAVIVSPTDRDLINEGSDTRRKFINGIICQYDKTHLQHLVAYNKNLEHRNALLRFFAANQTFDKDSLMLYDSEISRRGKYIYEERRKFISDFLPLFQSIYALISKSKESVDITYKSVLHQSTMEDILLTNLDRDRMLQFTGKGVHKDDLEFMIDGYPAKKFGSQGQQKSFLIALKLAQFDYIKQYCRQTPILLLDDIFDKLDEKRVKHIIEMMDTKQTGQIFISDTHSDRTERVIKNTHQSYKIFRL